MLTRTISGSPLCMMHWKVKASVSLVLTESEASAKEGSTEWLVGTNNSCYLDSGVKYM